MTSYKIYSQSSPKLNSASNNPLPTWSSRASLADIIDPLDMSFAQSPANGHIFEMNNHPDRRINEETSVITRPAWQAFLCLLQTHFPEMGEEIHEAHNIAQVPAKRVTLSVDALDFLNRYIKTWYEGGVEIATVTYWESEMGEMDPCQDVWYEVPYRPVSGLNVIVTPTVQRSLLPVEQVILREKEKWNQDEGLAGIHRYIRLCVFEDLVPPRSRRRGGGIPKEKHPAEGGMVRKAKKKESGMWIKRRT